MTLCRLCCWKSWERRLLFRCRPDCGARPDDLGLDYAETWADTPDGRRLHCWHIPGDTRPELTWAVVRRDGRRFEPAG